MIWSVSHLTKTVALCSLSDCIHDKQMWKPVDANWYIKRLSCEQRSVLACMYRVLSNSSAQSVSNTWSWCIMMTSNPCNCDTEIINFNYFCVPPAWWWRGWASIRTPASVWMNTVKVLLLRDEVIMSSAFILQIFNEMALLASESQEQEKDLLMCAPKIAGAIFSLCTVKSISSYGQFDAG